MDSYILQNEYELYKWAHVKFDIVNNEVNTEIAKTKEKIKTKWYSNQEEDVQNNIKRVYFAKIENQVKQGHREDIDKRFIQALKKLGKSYNPD